MIKKLLLISIALILVLSFLLSRAIFKKPIDSPQENQLSVVTTLYPLYDFATEIGKERINVFLLVPPGVEPHAFEPKPNDLLALNQADIFVYTGNFMEVWVQDLLSGLANKNLKVIDTSEGVKLISGVSSNQDGPAGSPDPHIWLDFENAKRMVDNITQGLIEKDPSGKDFYTTNATAYKKLLAEMDNKYRETLATCKSKKIVYGGHYAFGYLTRRYGLQYLPAVKGFAPDTEPLANDLAQLVDQVKRDNIRYIFYEELTSPKVAETLARETATELLLLNAAHNLTKEDLTRGVSFLSLMETNLANLKTGLECRE